MSCIAYYEPDSLRVVAVKKTNRQTKNPIFPWPNLIKIHPKPLKAQHR